MSWLETMPFAAYLGVTLRRIEDRQVLEMPFAPHLVGNPRGPVLHGGVMGALLELAAVEEVMRVTGASQPPRVVDFRVDYFRPGRAITSFASAQIVKQGRRIINVSAQMWQEDMSRPIAVLHGTLVPAP